MCVKDGRMVSCKEYSCSQGKFIPIHFIKQILPGTFEYTLNYLIDNELDQSVFDSSYKKDSVVAPAFDPAVLLKIVLFAYSKDIVSTGRWPSAAVTNERKVYE